MLTIGRRGQRLDIRDSSRSDYIIIPIHKPANPLRAGKCPGNALLSDAGKKGQILEGWSGRRIVCGIDHHQEVIAFLLA
jgi:hypothetical protein